MHPDPLSLTTMSLLAIGEWFSSEHPELAQRSPIACDAIERNGGEDVSRAAECGDGERAVASWPAERSRPTIDDVARGWANRDRQALAAAHRVLAMLATWTEAWLSQDGQDRCALEYASSPSGPTTAPPISVQTQSRLCLGHDGADDHAQAEMQIALAGMWRAIGDPLRGAVVDLLLAAADAASTEKQSGNRPRAETAQGDRAILLSRLPAATPAAVSILTLGRFELSRDGIPVDRPDWQSKKARDLLKLVVARRGRPATREWLMEALWPGQDPVPLSNRLSVALSTLRGVLDPEHRFAPDYFLAANAETIRLRVEHLDVDIERFLADGQSALESTRDGGLDAARARLEEAEAVYLGDFLEEDLYEDWAVPLREEARSLYTSVVAALADLAHTTGRHHAAIRYRRRALERDRWDEGAHLGLIAALVSARRHGEARGAYRDYVKRMQEIGVEPTPLANVSADPRVRANSAAA